MSAVRPPVPRPGRWWATLIVHLALVVPSASEAQLRPYDPLDWTVFEAGRSYTAALGGVVLKDQKASLAGTEGTLVEAGRVHVAVRAGRVAIEAAGTIQRFLFEDRAFAQPVAGTTQRDIGRRNDSGDYSIATTFMLLPLDGRVERHSALALRFGTRLPTTDNRVGIERDQTDFFALLAGRHDLGPVRLFAETGVGIHGTREPDFEQSDVLVFIGGATVPVAAIQPTLLLTGHADGLPDRAIRGNEELAEVRLRVRSTARPGLQVELIRGLGSFSPSWGLGVLMLLDG